MGLRLGPVLRHVGTSTALVWVQADRPCRVSVLGCAADTFEVSGFHYALVPVTGLRPDSTTAYQVDLDGRTVWPPADDRYPAPVIRTRGPESARRLTVLFGSCRYPKTDDPKLDARLGPDALDSYAARLANRPSEQWPDVLVLLGDQVYADELTPAARRTMAAHRRARKPRTPRPDDEAVSFAEYERLYHRSWSDPEVRWLLSTVSTAMIFDDHDVRDDWNTSAPWRAAMAATPWWRERIRAGLGSYWVYQHLGNLSSGELADDPDYRAVVLEGTGDRWERLAELADRADREVDVDGSAAKGVRFSFRWDLGRSRLVVADTRNGRILESGRRRMIGEAEFAWITEQATTDLAHVDHLVLGSSLPWLMPHAISDLQALNERAADRPGWRGRLAERVRQAGDLEHWPSFGESFRALTELIGRVARDPDGPASVCVLSGDVHHSYAARAHLPGPASVYQLVCSPVHNRVPAAIRPAFRLSWSRTLSRLTAWRAGRAGVGAPLRWTKVLGPVHGNTIATLRIRDRAADVLFEQPGADGADPTDLRLAARLAVSG